MTESGFNVARLLPFPRKLGRYRLGADSTRLFVDLLRVVDIAILFATGILLYLAYVQPFGIGLRSEYGRNVLLAAFFLPFVLEKAGCYKPSRLDRLGDLNRSVAVGCAILFVGLVAV